MCVGSPRRQMSFTGNSFGATTSSGRRRSSPASSSKRELDDYASTVPNGDEAGDFAADLVTARMRRKAFEAVQCSAAAAAGAASSSSSWASLSQPSPFVHARSAPPSQLQFFVRMISEGKTLVVQASSGDTVKSVHEKLHKLTGVPVVEQRFIYLGKQLEWEQSLAQCGIENDASLHLVGRLRSTEHPIAWQIMDEMITIICRLCKGETFVGAQKIIKTRISEYLSYTLEDEDDLYAVVCHLQIFMSSSAPSALTMLYMSPIEENKKIAKESIKHFIYLIKTELPKLCHPHCAPIVLEFCKLLGGVPDREPLYSLCRNCLGSLLETVKLWRASQDLDSVQRVISVEEIFPLVSELADRLSESLVSNPGLDSDLGTFITFLNDVNDFNVFFPHIRTAICLHSDFTFPISCPLPKKASDDPKFVEEIESLYKIFQTLLVSIDRCLSRLEEHLESKPSGEEAITDERMSQYVGILKELNLVSNLYVGSREQFWTVMRRRKRSLCTLVLRFVKRPDDFEWLLEHKDVTDFETRRHIAMLLFPEVAEVYDEENEMLIDRSQLLAESFNYVSEADPESLQGTLFMEFNNEEATGPGVMREWIYLVCQAIFDQQNALFVACPNDRSRFYPNPASKINPLNLKYFKFAGRMIAMALMHKVQVGVVFDRVFFLQLAGLQVSLEDIRDADPFLYNSCKQILEMDPDLIDTDILGLTFVREVEELGLRKVIELLPHGSSLAVTSKNRKEYINLLVRHQFVSSISEQVSHFAEGFADILSRSSMRNFFFRVLKLEDLDFMLRGCVVDICVEDWKAHTEYNGFKETDRQINWFWKIVKKLTAKEKSGLLFFWTSVKHLPVEGFRGLASRLQIDKSSESTSHLPISHTCFYRLCFPPYPTMYVMRARLNMIVKEHVGSGFGTG